ncbi:MAG: hypothetical protein ABIP13_02360 [Tepidiformaceae bacterium]
MPEDLRLNGFAGSYADGEVQARASGVFRLPPIHQGETPIVSVAKIRRVSPSGEVADQSGPWVLRVEPPRASSLREVLALQQLTAPSVSEDGITVAATAVRSRNSTEVTYTFPPGLTALRLPQIVVPGKDGRFAPLRDWNNGDGSHTASFVATSFDTPIQLDFGPFARQVAASDEARVTLDVDSIRSAANSSEPTRIPVLGTNEGNPGLVLQAHVTRRPGRPAHLLLVLQGNWPSESDPVTNALIVSWEVIDADGRPMKEDGWQENYSTDAGGKIGSGTTTVFVIYEDPAPLTVGDCSHHEKSRDRSRPVVAHAYDWVKTVGWRR